MADKLKQIEGELQEAIAACADLRALEAVRVKYLGRKGVITELLKQIGTIAPEERRDFGRQVNELKQTATEAIRSRKGELGAAEAAARVASEEVDVTLPGRRRTIGRKHIITQTLDEIIGILKGMGFAVAYGPELETDYYNYEALNFPPNHPARDMQDTFWIDDTHLLRTHTSPVQIRVMERMQPPVRVIMPGKCFRNDTWLGAEVEMRFRPSYFPFTEPSAEVDVTCILCKGSGCRVCKHSGWLELLGAGMVDPALYSYVGYDPERYTGYAWGLGIERLAMMKYGIEDIRVFFQNDIRFLEQF
jgi:phenylalanyl-tRNA synthetase alpha chain